MGTELWPLRKLLLLQGELVPLPVCKLALAWGTIGIGTMWAGKNGSVGVLGTGVDT